VRERELARRMQAARRGAQLALIVTAGHGALCFHSAPFFLAERPAASACRVGSGSAHSRGACLSACFAGRGRPSASSRAPTARLRGGAGRLTGGRGAAQGISAAAVGFGEEDESYADRVIICGGEADARARVQVHAHGTQGG
jgi:hypothetical protein